MCFIFNHNHMLPTQLMGHITHWQMMGNHSMCVGAFECQPLPFFDRWEDSENIDMSNWLHYLCNSAHLNVTVYRRAACLALCPHPHAELYDRDIVADVGRCVCQVQRLYLCTDTRPNVESAASHKKHDTLSKNLNDKSVVTRDFLAFLSPGPLRGAACQTPKKNVYVGMSVNRCLRCFNGDNVNNIDDYVEPTMPTVTVVVIDPRYNLTSPVDVQLHTEKPQPFVGTINAVLQTGRNTIGERAHSRIKMIAKERKVCFHKDKPWLRWLSCAHRCPHTLLRCAAMLCHWWATSCIKKTLRPLT